MYDSDNSALTGFLAGRADNGNSCNNGGFGFGGGWDGLWGIIILAMIFGWGNGGWGNGFGGGNNGANAFLPYAVGANGALTRADLCQDMNFQGIENGVRGIQQGICDSTFALNNTIVNGFNGVSSAICNLGYEQASLANATNVALMQGFHGVDNAICNSQFSTQQGFNNLATQISGCCCDVRSGLKDIQYQAATDTCAIQTSLANVGRDIIDNANCNTKQILDFMVNTRLQDLQNENQALRLSASQAAQNQYLISELRPCAKPAYITCSPFQSAYGFNGYNNGYGNCGCGCGCNG